ncbi:MAG: CHASE2 domain-containing protein [Hormoscilla sp. GUM202]|nr:CHASE2 domain-containing protein [Hormoscilla sp. GUM202]
MAVYHKLSSYISSTLSFASFGGRKLWQVRGKPAIIATVVVTSLLLASRALKILEAPELAAYDKLIQLRQSEAPDDRLLIVGVTEADIKAQQRWPLSDATINRVLQQLEKYQPRAIGLDIYRDIPHEPGRSDLLEHLQTSEKTIAICKFGEGAADLGIGPPPGMPASNLGFSDLAIDEDGIIRRSLLVGDGDPDSICNTRISFALQLAWRYLDALGIKSHVKENGDIILGETRLPRLDSHSGGYLGVDAGGYQILLNYRSPRQMTKQVTLMAVLNDQIDPNWVRDRIVLIGAIAPSTKDSFYTPYSAGKQENHTMPGVVVHAQIVSQILSAVVDGRPLLWVWPDWAEWLWIWVWSLVGGAIAWEIAHPLGQLLAAVVAIGILLGVSWLMFICGGWVPLVAPTLALILSNGGTFVYKLCRTHQECQQIALRVKEQNQSIELLQTLLKQKTQLDSADEATELPLEMASTEVLEYPTIGTPNKLLRGRYQILEILGCGGFAHTYLAADTQRPNHPQCVIKHLMPARSDGQFLQVARRLFHTEAEILDVLGRHDRIPQLLAYFEENKEFYLVEEFICGNHLSNEMPPEKQIPEKQVIDWFAQLLEIIAFIHSHNVIHRDIKPNNIIRRQADGRLCLIDFGAVKLMHPQLESTSEKYTVAIGTNGYAAPEQLAGQPRLNSDLYSLGMIGIQALTGLNPTQLRQDSNTGTVVWRHLAGVGPQLAAVLDKMVSYHFSDRYQSATEVLQDLKKISPASKKLPHLRYRPLT